jgi:hypothetical protein
VCHFVTATVPGGTDLGALARVLERHGLHFGRLENAHVQAQLPEGELYFCPTTGVCDCGTPLASARAGRKDRPTRLREKGWSEAKIARWLQQKSALPPKGATPSLSAWLALISAALVEVPHVGLLVHWYKGGMETEPIALVVEDVPRADLSVERLMRMKEDVLHRFLR